MAWRYWKGQPQYEDARAQRDAAYESWQAAKRAESTPKLATLHQRKQKAVDRARRRRERTKQEMDDALRRHHEDMEQRLERLRQDQLRLDEAEEGLRQVLLQVAAHAEADRQDDDEEPANRWEARGQVADARKGLESIQAQLQELYDQLEEQGNFVALDRINEMYGHLEGAVGGVEGAEKLLTRAPKPHQQRAAQVFAMDTPPPQRARTNYTPSGGDDDDCGDGRQAGPASWQGGAERHQQHDD